MHAKHKMGDPGDSYQDADILGKTVFEKQLEKEKNDYNHYNQITFSNTRGSAMRLSFKVLLWARGPEGPAGGLRPPVGLEYPNFEV